MWLSSTRGTQCRITVTNRPADRRKLPNVQASSPGSVLARQNQYWPLELLQMNKRTVPMPPGDPGTPPLVRRRRTDTEPLVDWREPERNAHVLDWRDRAHDFGLVPLDDNGGVEARVA